MKHFVHDMKNATIVIQAQGKKFVKTDTSERIVLAVRRKRESAITMIKLDFLVLDVRACADEPCLNNGTCVVYLRSYLCQCQKGFSGRTCEIGSTMRIFSSQCNRLNCVHGYCSKEGRCVCYNGWTSENCNGSFIIGKFNVFQFGCF